MPTRTQIISQTRAKQSADPGHKSLTKKQQRDSAVEVSTVTLHNIHLLHDIQDLRNTMRNHIDLHQNHDEQPHIVTDTKQHTIVVTLMEKNLALSLSRAIQRSTKHFQPRVTIHNPHDNIFYRIDVNFQKPKEKKT